jgi:hypothetical protein
VFCQFVRRPVRALHANRSADSSENGIEAVKRFGRVHGYLVAESFQTLDRIPDHGILLLLV